MQDLVKEHTNSALSIVSYLSDRFKTFLYDESHQLGKGMAHIEKQSGVKREYIAYGVLGLLSVYLVVGYFAELVCNGIGFAYPAYASMKALRTAAKEDDTQWLTYWVVFAVFSLIDFASEKIFEWFPLYWLAKCIFLVWLLMPMTKGAQKMWENYIGPTFDRYEAGIDSSAQQAVSAAQSAASGSRGSK